MFDYIVLAIQLAEAVEAAVPFSHHDTGAILLHLEKVLRLQVWKHTFCRRDNDTRNLGRKRESDLAPVAVGIEDSDTALLLKRLELLVGCVFRHRFSLLTDATGHAAPGRLEANYGLLKTDETSMAKQVQVDGLLIGVEPRSEVILEVLEELLEIHR
ncbi:MAG: hypothetical protein AB1640_09515 [bacterium]